MTNQIREAFPYFRVRNASEAIEFYKAAFGAVEDFRLTEPSGHVGHAELKFGPHTVMVSDEYLEYGIAGPEEGRSTGSSIHLHVDDVDAFTERAVSLGAKLTMKAADGFRLALSLPNEAAADAAFDALAEAGNVDMPMMKTFWSPRYEMVTDKFGVGWMVMVAEPHS